MKTIQDRAGKVKIAMMEVAGVMEDFRMQEMGIPPSPPLRLGNAAKKESSLDWTKPSGIIPRFLIILKSFLLIFGSSCA